MRAIPVSEIIGQRFGRLVGVAQSETINGKRRFVFRCDCGTEKSFDMAAVRKGATTSCGCYANELSRQRKARLVHGECHSAPEHKSWQAMIARCHNPNHMAFHNYGGRGISVCAQWRGEGGYLRFIADMGRRPTIEHTLDRIDVDGNYEPGNCRWADRATQAANKRRKAK